MLDSLRALTGIASSLQKETLLLFYKQYIRSVMIYSIPAWAPIVSCSQQQKLQATQYAALRITRGSTQTTPKDRTHAETIVLTL